MQQPSRRPAPGNRPPQQRKPQQPPKRKKQGNWWSRAYQYVRTHILLRNLIMAFSLGIILIFVINIILNIFTRHGQKYSVPNFIGQTVQEAQGEAKQNGTLQLEVIDSLYMPKQKPGMILDQSPKPGMGVKSGRRVFLTVNAFRPKTEVIPYVTGLSVRQAKNILENKGFEIDQLIYRSDLATNNVLEQTYKGNTISRGSELKAELGSAVTLTVGVNHGDPLPIVPKVIGLSLREAKSRLWELGLNVGTVRNDPGITAESIEDAKVYRQEPNHQSRNDYGGKVSLWLTTDPGKISQYSKESDAAARNYAVDGEDPDSIKTTPEEEENEE